MTGVQTCALPICFPVTILGDPKSEQSTLSSKILEAAKLFSNNNYEFITEEELIKRNSETVTSVRNTVYILDKNKRYVKAQVADCVYLEDGFHGIVTKITDKFVIVENGEEKRKIKAIWEEPPTNLLHCKGGEVFVYDNVTGKCYGQFGLATTFKYTDMSKNKEEMYLGCIGDIVYISIQPESETDEDLFKWKDTSSYITVMGKQGPIGFENVAVTEMIKFKPYTAIKEGEMYGNVRFITRVNE